MIVWDFPDHKDRQIDANRLTIIIKDFKERTSTMLDVTTLQKTKFPNTDFFSIYDQIRRKLQMKMVLDSWGNTCQLFLTTRKYFSTISKSRERVNSLKNGKSTFQKLVTSGKWFLTVSNRKEHLPTVGIWWKVFLKLLASGKCFSRL